MRSLLIVLLLLASFSVLLGCLFKIQHWPFADFLLAGGLLTEVACAGMLVWRIWQRRRAG